MKSTYLVYKNTNAPEEGLRIASKKEWNQILKMNKKLPRERRRFFIEDNICDLGKWDCMYIETSREKYDEWHREKMKSLRKHQNEPEIMLISGDVVVGTDGETVFDTIASSVNVEKEVEEKVLLQTLRNELSAWHEWAGDFFDLYINGQRITSCSIICQKYGVTERAARSWKDKFEIYIAENLKPFENSLPF